MREHTLGEHSASLFVIGKAECVSSGTNSVCKDLEVGHKLAQVGTKWLTLLKTSQMELCMQESGPGNIFCIAEMHNLLPWQIEWNCIICLQPWQILPAESLCFHIMFSLGTSSSQCIPQDVPNNTTLYPITFAQN